jgi:hypothetical protein
VIAAVDTSVLLDVFGASPDYLTRSQRALRLCRREGALIVCGVVLAELRPHFEDASALDSVLDTLGLQYVPLPQSGAVLAGQAWQAYRGAGGPSTRMIPDFLIAGHALTTADRLLSRDCGFYRTWFGLLDVVYAA